MYHALNELPRKTTVYHDVFYRLFITIVVIFGNNNVGNSAGHSCQSITDKDNVFVDSSNRLRMKPTLTT